jgi:molecular chaperone HscB
MSGNIVDKDELTQLFNKNPFDLFSIDTKYNLDTAKLKNNYLSLQKKYHPDNYVTQSKAVIDKMLLLSTHINQQYNLLLSPIDRALLLLKINNYILDLDDSSMLDKEFLFEQIELQESITDALTNEDKLSILEADLLLKLNNLEIDIGKYFLELKFDLVAILVLKLSFYLKLYNRYF